MTRKPFLTPGVCLAGLALAAPAGAQKATGPTALYWMDAETNAGLGAMTGGGRPGMGSMMGAMMSGGGGFNPNQANKNLLLELGSQQKPAGGAAEADHLPPSTLGAGRALPLTYKANPSPTGSTPLERPKGRMLIYWGCGERAGAGQPAVIDFAKLGRGAPMPQIGTVNIGRDRSPSAGGWATYGSWPNERTRSTVPPTGRLAGMHTVSSNYAPEISFTLTANQDFMAPLQLKADGKTAAGGTLLTWRPVPRATGYGAVVIGSQGRGDTVVVWSSSKSQLAGTALMDYLSPAEARRLIGQGVVMPPETTSCAVPAEVTQAVGEGGMVQMIAYGDEANFSYPPKPSNPKQPWKLEWSAKVRYKSTAMQMLGVDMAEMMGGGDEGYEDEDRPRGPQRGQQQQQPNRGRDIMRGLGGIGGLIRP